MWAKIKTWFYKLIGRKFKEDEVFGLEVFDENGVSIVNMTSKTLLFSRIYQLSVPATSGASLSIFLGSDEVLLGAMYANGRMAGAWLKNSGELYVAFSSQPAGTGDITVTIGVVK